jgi:hypothetical protein
MALSNPVKKTVEVVARESLVAGDVVALMVQSDGELHAFKFNNGDVLQTQDFIPIVGVVETDVDILSGDYISVVVQGLCKAKIYPEGVALTTGSPTAFLYLADEGSDAAGSGTFCSDTANTTMGAANVSNLQTASHVEAYVKGVRAIFVGGTTIGAGTTVVQGDVFVYNNPIII